MPPRTSALQRGSGRPVTASTAARRACVSPSIEWNAPDDSVYYELFDTAINAWINTSTDVDPVTAPWLGVVAESGCRYFAELAFPAPLVVGLAVTRLGASVTYRLAVFETGPKDADAPVPVAAVGDWVHVYVDRSSRRPVPIPDAIRALLESAVVE